MSEPHGLWARRSPVDPAPGLEAEVALARLQRAMFGARAPRVRLGRYRDLVQIGRGGMSVVYRARDEVMGRDVAIKVLHGDPARREHRLRAEAQALARLSHPNVVQVLGVGRHHHELYVVMELVEGQDAATWLRAEPRSWREVLEVFLAAGEGLAAAHAHGLVHRDFKPSNILVGDDGRVRVIDFGLATTGLGAESPGPTPDGDAGADRSGPDRRQTATGAQLGTPRYMAPEQHAGARVDPRADQWSFTVALWEALYGEVPFDALRGGVDPRALNPRGPAALQRVLTRALARDPEDRYPSMSAQLEHLRAIVDRRWRRRGTVALCLGLVGLGGLVALIGSSPEPPTRCDPAVHTAPLWAPSRREAIAEAFGATGAPFAPRAWARAEARLGGWIEAWSETYAQACHAVEARPEGGSGLPNDRRMQCLQAQLAEVRSLLDMLERADTDTVARADFAVQRLPSSHRCLAERDGPSVGHAERAEHDERMARISAHYRLGRYREATTLAREATARAGDPWLRAEASTVLGMSLKRDGELEASRAALQEAFDEAARRGDAVLAARAALGLMQLSFVLVDYEATERWGRHVAAWLERVTDPAEHLDLEQELTMARAEVRSARGDLTGALAELDRAWALCRPDCSVAPRLFNERGIIHHQLHQPELAMAERTRALELLIEQRGGSHPSVAEGLSSMADQHAAGGDYAAAEALLHRALEILEGSLGVHDKRIAPIAYTMGWVHSAQGEHDEAIAWMERALEVDRRTYGPEHPQVAFALDGLSTALQRRGDLARALELERRALRIYERTLGPEHLRTIRAMLNVVTSEINVERYQQAHTLVERALELLEPHAPHPDQAWAWYLQAELLLRLGHLARADARGREALALHERLLGPDDGWVHTDRAVLARIALADGRYEDAIAWSERVLQASTGDVFNEGLAASCLARALHGAGREAERIPGLVDQARRALVEAGPLMARDLEQLERWAAAEWSR